MNGINGLKNDIRSFCELHFMKSIGVGAEEGRTLCNTLSVNKAQTEHYQLETSDCVADVKL